jgi:hypothetical protein
MVGTAGVSQVVLTRLNLAQGILQYHGEVWQCRGEHKWERQTASRMRNAFLG